MYKFSDTPSQTPPPIFAPTALKLNLTPPPPKKILITALIER